MIQSSPVPLHERLDLSLFHVEEGRYSSLAIQDETYPHWLISFVRRGRVETETRGVRSLASDGDVMIHPPRLPFSERAAGPGLHQYIVFDLQVPPGLDLFRLHPVAPGHPAGRPGRLRPDVRPSGPGLGRAALAPTRLVRLHPRRPSHRPRPAKLAGAGKPAATGRAADVRRPLRRRRHLHG